MFISEFAGQMRSIKLNLSVAVLSLGLKAKIFENLKDPSQPRLCFC